MKLRLDLNLSSIMRQHVHGYHAKDVAVLHETVSPDYEGLKDILGIARYLSTKDYGIHGLTDAEGHTAWALGLGNAIFWQAGGVNERSVGIEQVSNIMLRSPLNAVRRHIWVGRNKQLRATAKLLAAWHNADPKNRPLRYSDGRSAGVTSHWDVSQHYPASEGHTDCWPIHKGGYYPMLEVIRLAKVYAATGLRF